MEVDKLVKMAIEWSGENSAGTILSNEQIERCVLKGFIGKEDECESGYLIKESDIRHLHGKIGGVKCNQLTE